MIVINIMLAAPRLARSYVMPLLVEHCATSCGEDSRYNVADNL